MQKEGISYLLKELSIVRMKYEVLYEQREQFNIFSVLHKEHDERRLHSRFIASLLNPEGSHGRGKKFLHYFLDSLNIDRQDYKTVEVYPNEWDQKEYKNIDIFIIDRQSQKAIIIENKIYAGDSNTEDDGQLERYFTRVNNEENISEKAITTLYLTLDGHEPSDESLGKFEKIENINGLCIAYSDLILKWLESCVKEVVNSPYLRESISQYKSLIEKMTGNQTDIEHRLAIRDTIAKNEESLIAAKELIDNFKHVKWHTVFDFWNELTAEIENCGYKISERPSNEQINDITHYEMYRKGQRAKQKCGVYFKVNDGFSIVIRHEADECLFFGCESGKVNDNYRDSIKEIVNENDDYLEDEEWLVWNNIFLYEKDRIWFNYFDHLATFQLINPQFRTKRIKSLIEKVKEFIKKVEDKMVEKSR